MKDFLGRDLTAGDYVSGLFSNNETPTIFQVVSFTPKKVRLLGISDTTSESNSLKYSKDLIKLDPDLVFPIIKASPKDMLGQDLAIGNYVFGSGGEYIEPIIYEITGFAPTIAEMKVVYTNGWASSGTVTGLTSDLIKVEPSLVTMYILTKEHE